MPVKPRIYGECGNNLTISRLSTSLFTRKKILVVGPVKNKHSVIKETGCRVSSPLNLVKYQGRCTRLWEYSASVEPGCTLRGRSLKKLLSDTVDERCYDAGDSFV